MITREQQEHLDDLRRAFTDNADAAREYDHLADVVASARTFHWGANKFAVKTLQELRDDHLRARDEAKRQLRDAEGWQSCR